MGDGVDHSEGRFLGSSHALLVGRLIEVSSGAQISTCFESLRKGKPVDSVVFLTAISPKETICINEPSIQEQCHSYVECDGENMIIT